MADTSNIVSSLVIFHSLKFRIGTNRPRGNKNTCALRLQLNYLMNSICYVDSQHKSEIGQCDQLGTYTQLTPGYSSYPRLGTKSDSDSLANRIIVAKIGQSTMASRNEFAGKRIETVGAKHYCVAHR